MSDDGTDRYGRRAPEQQADDLDRVFGPETASVPTRLRTRTWFVIGASTLAVAAVIAVVLGSIIGSVQNGIGGVFPNPDVALDRFDDRVADLPGVLGVRHHAASKTAFASYDAVATVRAEPTLDRGARRDLVAAISRAADEAGGNGVRVVAIADLGNLEVGVTGAGAVAAKRLALADALDRIGGVTEVRCSWERGGDASDDDGDQAVVARTPGRGAAVPPIVARVTEETQKVFPGADVQVLAPE
ncbi:hypothetical protein [Curtobacterium aurantiacum]|uniref:Uncharacterized protein n=1 Tax=Curtobacterium aurantiacum TaxID=3236919 RepID=A0ABS5VKH8_9MICO|nr:hypothetical protein [Curtobacterium flaccumfaciens]MBT1546403.1 hypothetical protein [Curtobacterium flaccumfaciens pv. flaccumfaciens]MBT1589395.1 hypothetical protein [Curtobacterium flaccumfaciens pv. flaccumfaciens]MBT1677219.1 hypothetical protein [Curtobacterium flaccumfaciens pv. flaccumfaciens]MBT1679320.1 hypothetical protein [Curtobacterium flaccumfaciens pv. flaccumfaciens]